MDTQLFIKHIQDLLSAGKLNAALEALLPFLHDFPDDDLYNNAILLNFQLTTSEQAFAKGLIPSSEFLTTATRISNAVLTTILPEIANPTPVFPNTPRPGAFPTSGKLLHNIPTKMVMGLETRCTVRLAPDESKLLKDFEKTPETFIADIEIAKIMEVRLQSEEQEAFWVESLTTPEQVLSTERYNEWRFMVTPLKEGNHRLLLRVMVIETVNGKDYKRETVLEKEIQINATVPVTQPNAASSWQFASVAFQYSYKEGSNESDATRGVEPDFEMMETEPEQPLPSKSSPPSPAPKAETLPPPIIIPKVEPYVQPAKPPINPPDVARKKRFGRLALPLVIVALLGGIYVLSLTRRTSPANSSDTKITYSKQDEPVGNWTVLLRIAKGTNPRTVTVNSKKVNFKAINDTLLSIVIPATLDAMYFRVSGAESSCTKYVALDHDNQSIQLDCKKNQ